MFLRASEAMQLTSIELCTPKPEQLHPCYLLALAVL